jgi:hypothetical protein
MELIPILSLIILVATISTFILAVGAYILYKARERKGITAHAPQPSAIPAELITPAPLAEQKTASQERKTYEVVPPQQQGLGYDQQRQQSYYSPPEEVKGPELRPTYVGSAPQHTARYRRKTEEQRTTNEERYPAKRKFMRYTNEGYVEPKQQDKKQEDNLRWR